MKSVALVEFIHAKVEHLVYYMLCGINVPKTKSVLYVALGTKNFSCWVFGDHVKSIEIFVAASVYIGTFCVM